MRGLLKPDLYIPLESPGDRLDTATARKKRQKTTHGDNPHIFQIPDTSMLLSRYMDSGRIINAYDWFKAFAVATNNEDTAVGGRSAKNAINARGEEDKEGERKELQARFLRSVHELEWMGFLKTTARRKDHVLRSAFDIPL